MRIGISIERIFFISRYSSVYRVTYSLIFPTLLLRIGYNPKATLTDIQMISETYITIGIPSGGSEKIKTSSWSNNIASPAPIAGIAIKIIMGISFVSNDVVLTDFCLRLIMVSYQGSILSDIDDYTTVTKSNNSL